MIVLDDDCWFVTCFDVLSSDGILSSCHDFQIHTSYSSWFENGLRACIITLIWNLFACFLWNQIKQFLKYDFLNSPALLLKSLFCVLTCEGLFDDQFRKYVFFFKKKNHHYFWNLFACLLAKYVTGGSFDKRNEGSFCTWGFRLHGYVYPRHCRKRAIVLHCTQHETRLSDSQNDFWIRFRCPTEWLANFQPGVSTQKGPKRVWKLLPSVSGSSIKNGRSSLSWSTLIVFLRNELDTWAIAFLAKPSSTPNRSFEKIGTGC